MFVKQSKKEGATLPSIPSNLSKSRPASPMPITAAATTQADGSADIAALNGEPANNIALPSSLLSPPTSPASTVHAAASFQPPQQLAEAKTDAEAQQIATARALAKAKEILQGGGTQAEAAEAAKIVAREILREFQLAKQTQKIQSGLGATDADVANKSDKPRKKKLLSSHLQSNGHHMPSTFKKFWRKSRKNKAREETSTVDEGRDDEGEEQPAQTGAGAPHLVTVIPMTATPEEDRHPAVEVRDGVEPAHHSHCNDEDLDESPNQPDVTNGIHDVASQIIDGNNSSGDSNSKTNRIQKKEEKLAPTTSDKPQKQRHKTTSSNIVSSSQRQPPPVKTSYNNNEQFSQTYSNESSDSDNYSYSEYDSYPHHNQGGHIYLDDNESVSVLTKEYMRDPNIMDVLSLEAVMEAVNKGIVMREDDEIIGSRKHHSRLKNGNLKDDDDNSVDRFLFSLWNALDCCGQNSEVAFSDKNPHSDRCRRGSGGSANGGFRNEIMLDDDGQYFDHQRGSTRNVGGSGSVERGADRDREPDRTRPESNLNGGGKSVSWADDAVDNILLQVPAKGNVEDEKHSAKQEFNLSRSNSSDGKGSKSSVRSAVKSSLKNMKNIMSNIQCAALTSMNNGEVDATSIYEQHRSALKAGNGIASNATTNGDDANWREMVNTMSTDPNWRAMVNDRLNYQGPNSPASSTGRGRAPGAGLYGMMNSQPQPQLHLHPQVGGPQTNQGSIPGQQQPWDGNHPTWKVSSPHPVAGGLPSGHVNMDPHLSPMPMPGRIPTALNIDTNVPPSLAMARIPSSHYSSLNTSPLQPMPLTGKIPSMGHHSVNASSNMMNLSLSIDSDDDAMDKYAGMEGEEDARRATASRSNTYRPPHTQQLVTQDSEIAMEDRYSGAPSRVMEFEYRDSMGNNVTQMEVHDPRTNTAQRRLQDANIYSNHSTFQPPFHNNGTAAYGNYGPSLSHKDLIPLPMANGAPTGNEMIYAQTTAQQQPAAVYGRIHPQQQQPMTQLLPQSPRRTFMA
eukprot:CCRYP_005943-RB/>CCRYP_005943-RB protein AED:0.03 eAED:0.03 QI:454/1/1/1/0.5/0.33/3/515/1013